MTAEDIEARARKLVAVFIGYEISSVTVDTPMTTALDLDSLDVIELLMEFEEEFEVEISDAEQTKWTDDGCPLSGIVALVQAKAAHA